MHINTAVMKHIIPLLEKREGIHIHKFNLNDLAETIFLHTGKKVNFRRVLESAVDLARVDLRSPNFSFNIDIAPEMKKELEDSSAVRRDRFRHLVVKNDCPTLRIGMKLEAVRSDVHYTINYILEPESQRVYFAAIVGFYGTSINGWCERVNLKQTSNAHSTPSTHYMSAQAASEYVYLLERRVSLIVVK